MLQKSTTQKVLDLFFEEPTKKHYLKEISRRIKKAHTSVMKIIKKLLKEGFIKRKIEKKGKRGFPFFEAEIEKEKFKKLKKIHNLEKIYFSGLIEYLVEKLMPKSIILFGSYSRGEDIESSDIDLFVESEGEELDLENFEKKLKRKINIIFSKNINEISKELKENILNGIVLEGGIELK